MKAPPVIKIPDLQAALEQHYDLTSTQITFFPGGEDAYGYTVTEASGERYYLKVYRRELNWDAVLGIPLWLYQQGLTSVVHAQPTTSGRLYVPFQPFTLALYPFVSGLDATKKPLDAAQLIELGRFLARLHAMQPPIPADVEPFDCTHCETYVRVLDSLTGAAASSDPYQRDLAAILIPLSDRLWRELENFKASASTARQENAPFVLCHGDPSMGNVITSGKHVSVIDWDGIIHAPKERDLMHFGADDQPDSAPVFQGYAEAAGALEINPTIIRYYRHQWNIQEVADFGSRILFDDTADVEQKAHDLAKMREFLDYSGLG